MKIDKQTTPLAAMEELAGRLAQRRIQMGLTQAQLAAQAGVGKRTIERIEKGCDTQVTTLIRLLGILNLADRLDQLIPEGTVTPMAILKAQTKPPKRARRKKTVKSKKPWKWGDE